MTVKDSRARVLLGGADRLQRDAAALTLEEAGFAVQTTASGAAAVAACAQHMPDIVVMDVATADGDGCRACADIRSMPGGATVPIVMITGPHAAAALDRAYEAGATDFAIKPVGGPLLVQRLRYLLRAARQRQLADARIHKLAYFDALTGLPNREWIGEHLSRSLCYAQYRAHRLAVLFIDLDQFKQINDTLGHETGDALLRRAAQRLGGALPQAGVRGELARVGGDEFIAVLTGDPTRTDAERAARSIQQALATPFQEGGCEFLVTPSTGIALFPEHGRDVHTLLKNADSAMYDAKAGGRNQFRLCTSAVTARTVRRLRLALQARWPCDADGGAPDLSRWRTG